MRKPATSKAHFPPAAILGARENPEPCKAQKARRSLSPSSARVVQVAETTAAGSSGRVLVAG
jgi:hypothetical protein